MQMIFKLASFYSYMIRKKCNAETVCQPKFMGLNYPRNA